MGRPSKAEVEAREAAKAAQEETAAPAEEVVDTVDEPEFATVELPDGTVVGDGTEIATLPAAPSTWDAYEAKLRDDLRGFLVGRQIESAVKFARDAWNAARAS